MENPSRQQDSDVGSTVIGYVQASSRADSMSSVEDSSPQGRELQSFKVRESRETELTFID